MTILHSLEIIAMEKIEAQTPKMERKPYFTSFLNRIGGVFLAPDATFSQIIAERIGFLEPLMLMIMLVAIEGAVVASFAYRVFSAVVNAIGLLTGGVTSAGFFTFAVAIVIFVMIFGTLIVWVILAAIAHVSARYVFRGRGSFVQLMKLYGYTLVPISLVILSTVLMAISWVSWPLVLFLNIVATFWNVLLMAVAVKHNYGIDIGKAFISSFIGPMTVWLIIVGSMWAWMWLIIHSLTGGIV
jgi:hypothetical protein